MKIEFALRDNGSGGFYSGIDKIIRGDTEVKDIGGLDGEICDWKLKLEYDESAVKFVGTQANQFSDVSLGEINQLGLFY